MDVVLLPYVVTLREPVSYYLYLTYTCLLLPTSDMAALGCATYLCAFRLPLGRRHGPTPRARFRLFGPWQRTGRPRRHRAHSTFITTTAFYLFQPPFLPAYWRWFGHGVVHAFVPPRSATYCARGARTRLAAAAAGADGRFSRHGNMYGVLPAAGVWFCGVCGLGNGVAGHTIASLRCFDTFPNSTYSAHSYLITTRRLRARATPLPRLSFHLPTVYHGPRRTPFRF